MTSLGFGAKASARRTSATCTSLRGRVLARLRATISSRAKTGSRGRLRANSCVTRSESLARRRVRRRATRRARRLIPRRRRRRRRATPVQRAERRAAPAAAATSNAAGWDRSTRPRTASTRWRRCRCCVTGRRGACSRTRACLLPSSRTCTPQPTSRPVRGRTRASMCASAQRFVSFCLISKLSAATRRASRTRPSSSHRTSRLCTTSTSCSLLRACPT
mmetsp:Transcript_25835/g.50108  ORF Transcript_25835/g.50108 Transcript_25835/m.50108 type:complete len:219 (+) Transcript_25835:295-951(+)